MKRIIVITLLAVINSMLSVLLSGIVQMKFPDFDLMNLHVFIRVICWLVPILFAYILVFTLHRIGVEYGKWKSLLLYEYIIVLIFSLCLIIPVLIAITGSLNSEFASTLLYVVTLSGLFIKIYEFLIKQVLKQKK